MSREKILVPLGPANHDFNALYHALSVAERIQAKVYVVYPGNQKAAAGRPDWMAEHLKELIGKACQQGLAVSCHISAGPLLAELVDIINEQQIDLIIFESDGDNGLVTKAINEVLTTVPIQAVQVNGKPTSTYRLRKDGVKCRSS